MLPATSSFHITTLFRRRHTVLLLFMLCIPMLWGQGTAEDYRRAFGIQQKYGSQNVFYSWMNPHWIAGRDAAFWYVRNTPDGEAFMKVDATTGRRDVLLDPDKLAAALAAQGLKDVNPRAMALRECRVTPSTDTLHFAIGGSYWCYDIKRNVLERRGQVPLPGKQPHWMVVSDERDWGPVDSPDGQWTAFIRNDNVWVRHKEDRKERQLSIDGCPGNYYSTHLRWSPDSRNVAAVRIRPAQKRFVHYVESSPKDQLQPILHTQEYAKPGDELNFRVPCIFSTDGEHALVPSTELFEHQYYVTEPSWSADSRNVTFEFNERGHKVYRLLEMSATDGKVRPIVEEREEKYVNYPRIFRQFIDDGRQLLWSSERDGYNHLYLYDTKTGKCIRQITKGAWYVRDVQRVDEQERVIYFSSNGMRDGEDPYHIHYYRIGMDGRDLRELTPDEGHHSAWYSPDGRYLVDLWSTITQAPQAVVRSSKDGRIVMRLEKADISRLLDNGWQAPEVFHAPGRDGKTEMWGLIYRPSNFNPSQSYPVVEYIYSGPGDQYVPKAFTPYNWVATSLAELGFIVVQVDGMTTSFRSKAFEEVCYKNLRDAGLPDHMAWIRAAAGRYPCIDTTRVGIYGMSAGGQESLAAVLFHPEFYKAAYSSCGCHDNRMDKIWWNELWMGYPVDSTYSASSNVDNAWRLSRPLMLVVGELDDNVDPASTMQVADALIRAGKDFELVVIPGAHHTMGDAFGEHKRYDFFVKNLMGVEPPRWDEMGKH